MKIIFIIFIALMNSVSHAEDLPFSLKHAIEVIESTYGDDVFIKPKTLLKFGRSTQVDNTTFTTLMAMPSGTLNETYVSTNAIDKISSSSGSDTQTVVIEGHKCLANGDKIFVVQSKTLAGQTETALDTPLCRTTRIYNNGTTDLVGTIYVYEDDTVTAGVPQTGTKVHCVIPAGYNQSFKASTTVSSTDYWIITGMNAAIETKTGSPIAEIQLQVRQNGKVFRTQSITSVATAGATSVQKIFDPPIIVPKNGDVRLRALGSASGLDITGFINGYLAKIKE